MDHTVRAGRVRWEGGCPTTENNILEEVSLENVFRSNISRLFNKKLSNLLILVRILHNLIRIISEFNISVS